MPPKRPLQSLRILRQKDLIYSDIKYFRNEHLALTVGGFRSTGLPPRDELPSVPTSLHESVQRMRSDAVRKNIQNERKDVGQNERKDVDQHERKDVGQNKRRRTSALDEEDTTSYTSSSPLQTPCPIASELRKSRLVKRQRQDSLPQFDNRTDASDKHTRPERRSTQDRLLADYVDCLARAPLYTPDSIPHESNDVTQSDTDSDQEETMPDRVVQPNRYLNYSLSSPEVTNTKQRQATTPEMRSSPPIKSESASPDQNSNFLHRLVHARLASSHAKRNIKQELFISDYHGSPALVIGHQPDSISARDVSSVRSEASHHGWSNLDRATSQRLRRSESSRTVSVDRRSDLPTQSATADRQKSTKQPEKRGSRSEAVYRHSVSTGDVQNRPRALYNSDVSRAVSGSRQKKRWVLGIDGEQME